MAKRRNRRRSGGAGPLTLMLLIVVAVGTLFTVWVFGLWPKMNHPAPDEQPAVQPGLADDDGPTQGASRDEPPTQGDETGERESEPEVGSGALSTDPTQVSRDGFSHLYYYEADKAARYVSYQAANPRLAAEEVVWRVNMEIDGTPYVDYVAVADTTTDTYIVNKHHKLSDNFVPDNLVDLAGYQATENTVKAYYAMQADAKAQGYIFSAISAYRSIDSQRNLYNGYLQSDSQEVVDTYSARPGFSEHHTGRAIDLAGSSGGLLNFENTPECAWVHENAYKYGFILRYPFGYEHLTGYDYEPWHITYVGVDVATDMKHKGIVTLEEYTVKYLQHKPA